MAKGKNSKSKKSRNYKMSVDNNVPYAPSKKCKFTYWDEVVLGQSSGVPTLQQWRINSIFDPDLTSVGHQPYYYDQLSLLYKKYKVYAMTIDFQFTGDSNASIVFRPAVTTAAPAQTSTGFQLENERPMSTSLAYSSGGPVTSGRLVYYPRKILGLTKDQYNDESNTEGLMGGLGVGSNPAIESVLNMMCFTTASNSVSVLRYKITYSVKLFDRIVQTSS